MRFLIFIFFPIIFLFSNTSYSNNEDTTNDLSKSNDIIGEELFYTIGNKDTLIDIARKYDVSFADILSANGEMDPWLPEVNKKIIIPKKHILPNVKRDGVIINLGDLRIYFYKNNIFIGTYPIGIGRSGWETPLGIAKVIKKKVDPYWIPPESVREEDPSLPKIVAPGEDNPLGNRAIYISIPSYLIHGTNKPYGVGMKVSHGCIRLYPEDIETLFELVEVGTKVNIVNQPIKVGWYKNNLYMEVHELPAYASEKNLILNKDRKSLFPLATIEVQKKAGIHITIVDWPEVFKTVLEAKGVPIKISNVEQ